MTTSVTNKWKVLARHKNWVPDCLITESVLESDDLNTPSIRRFTATIDGFRGWKIYEGPAGPDVVLTVKLRTHYILDRIKRGDDAVFYDKNPAERSVNVHYIYSIWFKLRAPAGTHKHLIGVTSAKRGVFLVNTASMVLDRKVYREIAAEAKAEGIDSPFTVYCRLCSYSGPGLDVIQLPETLSANSVEWN